MDGDVLDGRCNSLVSGNDNQPSFGSQQDFLVSPWLSLYKSTNDYYIGSNQIELEILPVILCNIH